MHPDDVLAHPDHMVHHISDTEMGCTCGRAWTSDNHYGNRRQANHHSVLWAMSQITDDQIPAAKHVFTHKQLNGIDHEYWVFHAGHPNLPKLYLQTGRWQTASWNSRIKPWKYRHNPDYVEGLEIQYWGVEYPWLTMKKHSKGWTWTNGWKTEQHAIRYLRTRGIKIESWGYDNLIQWGTEAPGNYREIQVQTEDASDSVIRLVHELRKTTDIKATIRKVQEIDAYLESVQTLRELRDMKMEHVKGFID